MRNERQSSMAAAVLDMLQRQWLAPLAAINLCRRIRASFNLASLRENRVTAQLHESTSAPIARF